MPESESAKNLRAFEKNVERFLSIALRRKLEPHEEWELKSSRHWADVLRKGGTLPTSGSGRNPTPLLIQKSGDIIDAHLCGASAGAVGAKCTARAGHRGAHSVQAAGLVVSWPNAADPDGVSGDPRAITEARREKIKRNPKAAQLEILKVLDELSAAEATESGHRPFQGAVQGGERDDRAEKPEEPDEAAGKIAPLELSQEAVEGELQRLRLERSRRIEDLKGRRPADVTAAERRENEMLNEAIRALELRLGHVEKIRRRTGPAKTVAKSAGTVAYRPVRKSAESAACPRCKSPLRDSGQRIADGGRQRVVFVECPCGGAL